MPHLKDEYPSPPNPQNPSGAKFNPPQHVSSPWQKPWPKSLKCPHGCGNRYYILDHPVAHQCRFIMGHKGRCIYSCEKLVAQPAD